MVESSIHLETPIQVLSLVLACNGERELGVVPILRKLIASSMKITS